MTDIASLGLEIRSDGVVVATDRLSKFRREAGLAESAAGSLKTLATMGLAAVAVGLAAFGVGIGGAVKRMEEMRKLTAQVDQALKNSGNSARTSANEIEAWADRLERRTGRAAEEIMGVSANLASFGFSRQAFFRSLELADDMSAAWGGDLKQNLEGLARALAEPEKGLAMLTKRGITFTEEQKKMIAGFVQANDLAGAQGVIFEALEAQVKGVAEAGFAGLERAMARASKAWEDAFEDLVRGDGEAGDLRDTLVSLAETVSSPEFINAVMGFGGFIIQAVDLAAKAIIALWGKIQEFMNWLNARQPANMAQDDLASQLATERANLAKARLPGNGMGGVFGDATPRMVLGLEDRIAELEAELTKRSDPTAVDVNGIVGGLGQTHDTPDAMWRALSPGTMGGQTVFNPYEGMDLGGGDGGKSAEKARKAYADITRGAHEFIAAQGLEAEALGMTEQAANRLRHEQDLLNQAANDNINLSPVQRQELSALAEEMAAVEERTRSLTEWYNIGKSAFGSFMSDFKRDLMSGTSLWESFGNAAGKALDSIADRALSMAANGLFDMLFGAVMGGLGGNFMGGSLGAPALQLGFQKGIPGFEGGGYTGSGARTGGMDGKGGFLATLHPNETVIDHTRGGNVNSGSGGITITNIINVPAGAGPETAPAIAREVTKELRRQLPDAIQTYNRNPLRRAS